MTRSERLSSRQSCVLFVRPRRPKLTLVSRSPRSGGMWFLASDVGPEPTQPVQSALGRGDLLCWLERSGAARRGARRGGVEARSEHAQRSRRRAKRCTDSYGVEFVTAAGRTARARRKTQDTRHFEYSVTPSLTDVQSAAAAAAVEITESAVAWDKSTVSPSTASFAADRQVRRDRMRFNARVMESL